MDEHQNVIISPSGLASIHLQISLGHKTQIELFFFLPTRCKSCTQFRDHIDKCWIIG